MNQTGYIMLSRRILDDDWWEPTRPRTVLEAWIDLIFLARWAAGSVFSNGHEVDVGRGELLASERFLAERWLWSRNKVRHFLSMAQRRDRLVTVKETSVGTVYRIVNYDRYQATPTTERTSKKPAEDQRRTKENTGNTSNTRTTPAPAARADAGEPSPALPPAETPPAPKSWSALAIEMANAAGYFWPGGRVAAALKPHVERDGWRWVERVWDSYLRNRKFLDYDLRFDAGRVRPGEERVADDRFVSPQDFAKSYGYWDKAVTPNGPLKAQKEDGRTGDLDGQVWPVIERVAAMVAQNRAARGEAA